MYRAETPSRGDGSSSGGDACMHKLFVSADCADAVRLCDLCHLSETWTITYLPAGPESATAGGYDFSLVILALTPVME